MEAAVARLESERSTLAIELETVRKQIKALKQGAHLPMQSQAQEHAQDPPIQIRSGGGDRYRVARQAVQRIFATRAREAAHEIREGRIDRGYIRDLVGSALFGDAQAMFDLALCTFNQTTSQNAARSAEAIGWFELSLYYGSGLAADDKSACLRDLQAAVGTSQRVRIDEMKRDFIWQSNKVKKDLDILLQSIEEDKDEQ